MTINTDIAARLMEAYNNMGTAAREDLKEAAEIITTLQDRLFVGNQVLLSVVRALADATGKTAEQVITEYRWSAE